MKIAIIGGGVMGESILKCILKKRLCGKQDIVVSDVMTERLKKLEKRYGTAVTLDNLLAIQAAKVVVIGVKPQDITRVLGQISGHLDGQLIISIAAGYKLDSIKNILNYDQLIRAMPNTPAQIGKGITVWTADSNIATNNMNIAKKILGTMGEEHYFKDEKYIDMATAISGSGPAYIYLFIESMIDAGVHIGLPRDVSTKLVIATIKGSVELARVLEKHPAELKNMVTSPAGTTAEALLQLESDGLRPMLIKAVIAAYNKSKTMDSR